MKRKRAFAKISNTVEWKGIDWSLLPKYTGHTTLYVSRKNVEKYIEKKVKEAARIFNVNPYVFYRYIKFKNVDFYEELDILYKDYYGCDFYSRPFQECLNMFKMPDTAPYTSRIYKVIMYISKELCLIKKKAIGAMFEESYVD